MACFIYHFRNCIIRHVFHNTWNELGICTSMKNSMRLACVCVCLHRAAFLRWIFARSKSVGFAALVSFFSNVIHMIFEHTTGIVFLHKIAVRHKHTHILIHERSPRPLQYVYASVCNCNCKFNEYKNRKSKCRKSRLNLLIYWFLFEILVRTFIISPYIHYPVYISSVCQPSYSTHE